MTEKPVIIKALAFIRVFAVAAPASGANLYMDAGNTVYQFDGSGNAINSAVVDVNSSYTARGLAFGPDKRLYVGVSGDNRVDSFDLNLGSHVTEYVAHGQGQLFSPSGATFGPDGNLYVVSFGTLTIDRFFGPSASVPGGNDPSSYFGPAVFNAGWSSSKPAPFAEKFASNGTLYVSSQNRISWYDSPIPLGFPGHSTSFGPINLGQMAINSGGTLLYVRANNQVVKLSINPDHSLTLDGSFSVSYPAGLDNSLGLAFGPDGVLYTTTHTPNGLADPSKNADYVVQIDPTTGAATPFIQGNIDQYTSPLFLTFAPVPEPCSLVLSALGVVISLVAGRRGRKMRKARNV